MALSLKDAESDRLAREVAKLTGESLTEAVRTALAERLERRWSLRRSRKPGWCPPGSARRAACAAPPGWASEMSRASPLRTDLRTRAFSC